MLRVCLPSTFMPPREARHIALCSAQKADIPPRSRHLRCGATADHPISDSKRAGCMAVDYDVEYNNRARVPEHAEIFARWTREAAAYRERMRSDENAELGLAYGPSARQKVDLFFPEATGHTPLALFVHGGYWRSLEHATFSHVAAGLNARGIAVAVAGYDLCPPGTPAPPACSCGAASASASWSTATRPAGIWPPAWWRPTGSRSIKRRRPTWCRPAIRSPACST